MLPTVVVQNEVTVAHFFQKVVAPEPATNLIRNGGVEINA
jgi:hypothetical protein